MKALFLAIIVNAITFGQVTIVGTHRGKFLKERLAIERYVYKFMEKQSLNKEFTYVAIPWWYLMEMDKKALRNIAIPPVKRGVTVCEHIYVRDFIPYFKKLNIGVVFSQHAIEEEIDGIKIFPFPMVALNTGAPVDKKTLWFSFVGNYTHPCRNEVLKLQKTPNTIVRWAGKHREYNRPYYRQVLVNSRFSLCPRGTGPSSIRIYESLKAGAIPVIIADELRLPEGFNWDKCSIRVPESQIHNIPEILKSITPEQEVQMREACYKAYETFKPENFLKVINHYLNKIQWTESGKAEYIDLNLETPI